MNRARLSVLLLLCGAPGCPCDSQLPADRGPTLDLRRAQDGGPGDRKALRDALGDQAAPGPHVAFVSPADGATVPNPVKFVVSASGVQDVEIIVDKVTHLSAPWDPGQKDSLLYRFSGTGTPRAIHLSGRVGGKEVAGADITITVAPDPCEDRFFVDKFNANNVDSTGSLDLTALREGALLDVKAAVAKLQACGAKVTLGGMLSLLTFEGGLRLAFYNTKCSENSYHKMPSGCDAYPKALYSYQLGLGTIHTSNFHPCAGTYTDNMRKLLLSEIAAAGFSVAPSLATSAVKSKVETFCPAGTPVSAVDYYILSAHDLGVPRNGSGNALAAVPLFPFFTARVSVTTAFAEISASCSSIGSDNAAIAAYGGTSSYYKDPAVQQTILALYKTYAAASCN